MEIKIAENMRIEVDIPLLNVENFNLHWRPNEHTMLSLEGYINNKISYSLEHLYNGRLMLILEKDEREQTLFNGYIIKAKCNTVADMQKIFLCVVSGSWLLDQKKVSNSFQSIEKTYSDTVKQATENSGGKVICTKGMDDKLNRPLIQFNETAWEFAKRLVSHLESSIIPDIETGNPNFWFGMRKGREIPDFFSQQYIVKIKHNSENKFYEACYLVESKEFCKIGDHVLFLNEHMIVSEVSAYMRQGELFFTYLLKRGSVVEPIYQSNFSGLSLSGTILDTKDESIKVALDIDNNVSTGSYYYPWYPKTGNAFYAMPEIGAKIQLYFPDDDERNGFCIECFPEKKKKFNYEDRCLASESGNLIQLFDSLLCFSKGDNQSMQLRDNSITIGTSKQLQLSAEGKVQMRAKRIYANSEEEITIYKS